MSIPLRVVALAVLMIGLIVSTGYSAESTSERPQDLLHLVAPVPEIVDGGLLVDMVGFVGSSNVAFSNRSDWEQRQREGNATIPAVGPGETSADRMGFLEENTILPVASPDPPAVSDPFEFREDHTTFRNVGVETATSSRFEFREDHTAFRNVRGNTGISSGEDIQFFEENSILPARGDHVTDEGSRFLPFDGFVGYIQ